MKASFRVTLLRSRRPVGTVLPMKDRAGFTLIEIVVGLIVVVVLTAIIIPLASSYIDQARLSAAESDCKTIAEAVSRFESDMGRYPFYTSGSGFLQDSGADVVRLDGPGSLPTDTNGGIWTNNTITT